MLKFLLNKGDKKDPTQGKVNSEIDVFFQKKVEEMGEEAFEREFINFQKKIGEVRPHESIYSTFVDYYLNCFLFENEKKSKIPFNFIHSLFYIKKSHEKFLVLKDYLSNQTLSVTSSSYSFHGVLPKSFLQGFVFCSEGKYSLGNGFIVYEPDKKDMIKEFHKKLKGAIPSSAFLRHLANIKLSSDRNSRSSTVFKIKVKDFFK